MTLKEIREEIEKEFTDGEFVSFSGPEWNLDNITGYNSAKEEFGKFLSSALDRQSEEIAELVEEMPDTDIERESDEFDLGMKRMKQRLLTKLKND